MGTISAKIKEDIACGSYKVKHWRRRRHPRQGTFACMLDKMMISTEDIRNMNMADGNGVNDRTTTGTMQSNMQHLEVCHGNLV